MKDKRKSFFEERREILKKYGTLKFTRFDPKIKAGRLDPKKWPGVKPHKININCEYINPLYERYRQIVAPGFGPTMCEAQDYDFECIIIMIAKLDLPPDEKIKMAEREIDSIMENNHDYLPTIGIRRDLYPVRAIGTIYEGSRKYVASEPLPIEEYRKLFER